MKHFDPTSFDAEHVDPADPKWSEVPTYQIYPLMEGIKQAIRPWVKEGETLIWRDAWRWKNDNGVLPNCYECYSIEEVCGERGFVLVHYFHHVAVVRAAD